MKYEAVFGDQSLFDGAPEDAEMAASVCQMPRWYTMFDGKVLFCDSKKESWQSADFNHPSSQLLAMRRIIAEPKRWTVEDQKAGRMPKVGAKVDGGKVVFVNGFNVVTELKSGAVIVSLPKTFLNTFKPIETPDEKAQREEDEFIDSLRSVEIHDGTVSGFFNQGARAAYRKLKGGE